MMVLCRVVVPQAPPVSDLDRLRRTGIGAAGVGASPIPAHHLHAGMPTQLVGEGTGSSVGQQVDRYRPASSMILLIAMALRARSGRA